MTCRYGAILLACALTLGTALAQTPVPLIKYETRVVLVDAVAVDKRNNFVRDLARKDFRIWDDGKEQKITGFSLETAGLTPERSSKHYIILFFDTATLSPSNLTSVRQDAIRFVDRFATPDRYMAVIAYSGGLQILQNFTADAARLKAALARVQGASTPQSAGGAPAPVGRLGRGGAANQVDAFDASAYRGMLASLRTTADSVAAIRGRKALVLFSGVGAASEIDADLAAAINACNKANVAIYGVTGQGLIGKLKIPAARPGAQIVFGFQRGAPTAATSPTLDASNSQMVPTAANQSILHSLTDGTGGLLLASSNDLTETLGKVAEEQDDYYLLGYTPAVESPEGSCHTLQVKVDRSGLGVRARKGYCTSKPADPLGNKPEGKQLETRAAGNSAGNIAAAMQLPWFYSGPGVARVELVMDIVPSALKLEKIKGKLQGELDLAGVAYRPDGSVAARMSDAIKLAFDDRQQADVFLRTPYHYVNRFEIVPGDYDFRMAIGSGERGFGKVEMPLKIDPWDGRTLAMSGLALSHNARPYADLTAGLDASLLEGTHPLVSKGMEVIPAATTRFRAGEQGYVYFEAYAPPTPALSVRMRILDRATGQQKDDSKPIDASGFVRPGNAVVPIAMVLQIDHLPAGTYQVEISVLPAAGQQPLVRTANFDVN